MPHLLRERILDSDVGAATLVQPSLPPADVSVSTVGDLNEPAPSMAANALATPLTADDSMPSLSPGRIPDLGFLQNLPAPSGRSWHWSSKSCEA